MKRNKNDIKNLSFSARVSLNTRELFRAEIGSDQDCVELLKEQVKKKVEARKAEEARRKRMKALNESARKKTPNLSDDEKYLLDLKRRIDNKKAQEMNNGYDDPDDSLDKEIERVNEWLREKRGE